LEEAVFRSQELNELSNPMEQLTGTRLAQKIPDIFWDPSILYPGNEVGTKV